MVFLAMYLMNHAQVVADHTVVDQYDRIPQKWIDIVKTKWVSISGASHATAYHRGLQELYDIDSNYPVTVQYDGVPNGYQTNALRSSGATWGSYSTPDQWTYIIGRGDWWTNDVALERIKKHLQYCHDNGPELFAMLYGWSFDANFDHVYGNGPYGEVDPVYHVRWAGSTLYGKDGNLPFGLNRMDSLLVGNGVSMNNYINSVEAYNQYCEDQDIKTKVIFSTGPVDDNDTQGWNINERGYQQYLKWQYIRDYVEGKEDVYFFDLADILSYNDKGEQATTVWTDHNSVEQRFPIIHPDNMKGDYIGHIGTVGAMRLGKAMWWMLARLAGWEGDQPTDIQKKNDDEGIKVSVSQDQVNVSCDTNAEGQLVSLHSLSGQLLDVQQINGSACRFQISSLPKGIYLVVLESDVGGAKKIIKM